MNVESTDSIVHYTFLLNSAVSLIYVGNL